MRRLLNLGKFMKWAFFEVKALILALVPALWKLLVFIVLLKRAFDIEHGDLERGEVLNLGALVHLAT